MSEIRDEILYTKTDEWVKVDNGVATIGITDYAQGHLGDIVFIEPCEEDQMIQKEDVLTTVESVKSASDIYSPLSGRIIAFNSDLDDEPGVINKDPYDQGWICKIQLQNLDELDEMLTPEEYRKEKDA